ncbi:hypothetical protein JCM10212_002323 [Sporobolomyces blumeae]
MLRPLVTLALALAGANLASCALVVSQGKLSLVDSVGASAVASTTFSSESPTPLALTPLSSTDTLKLSFVVHNDHGEPVQPEQAVISFLPVDPFERREYGRQWASVVKVRNTGKARWELDLARAPTGLLSLSKGEISATLLVGQSNEPGVAIPLGQFTLSPSIALAFPYPPNDELPKHWEVDKYGPRPEIEWTFRDKEKEVNPVVALVGLAMVLSPWAVLVAVLSSVVPLLNLRRPTPAQAIFVASLVAFEALFVVYWVGLRLLSTLPYFCALAVVSFGSGRVALGEMRRVRLERERQVSGKAE